MSFTQQQLEAAWQQMEQERQEDLNYAFQAANSLDQLLKQTVGAKPIPTNARGFLAYATTPRAVSPFPEGYDLVISLTQYDDWHGMISQLQAAGVQMQPWNGQYNSPPTGTFDLSNNPTFANRLQQKYTVAIELADAHASGW